jgi:biopolymer transport protein ExbB
MLANIFLQAVSNVVDSAAIVVPKEDSLSLLQLIMKGGFIMIPVGILSVISIYIFIERFATIKKARKLDSNLMNVVKDNLMKGNLDAARSACKASSSPAALMIDKGISRLGKSTKEIESAMESVGKLEIAKLEKNTNVLGVIAGIAPMMGFIGTVSGVIKIFYNISLADNISIGLISGGLYEKMITSAAGLVVGVFSFICFHYLQAMIDRVSFVMEKSALEFMDIISE